MTDKDVSRDRPLNRILVVDDDEFTRLYIENVLEREGFEAELAASGAEAVDKVVTFDPDLVLLDVIMPEMNGYQTFEKIRCLDGYEHIPIIFVTAVNDPENIVRVFEHGGADYVGKPIRENELLIRIRLHLELERQQIQNDLQMKAIVSLQKHLISGRIEHPNAFGGIKTHDKLMYSVFQYAEAIAPTSWPVLVSGETGTGKELISKAIHRLSGRKGQFVAVNVAGLDDNLFADALFGHKKGAFTSADRDRPGLIEQATGGTIFLDEIGDLEPASQVKLLRLVQQGEYYPLGSDKKKMSDARVVVATNRPLEKMINDGSFRRDLYYRLRTHHIHLPALRDRKGDLAMLLDNFIKGASDQLGRPVPAYDDNLIRLLHAYDFPGNIRELEGMVLDAVARAKDGKIDPSCFKEVMDDDALGDVEKVSLPEPVVAPSGMTGSANFSGDPLEAFLDQGFPSLKDMTDLLIDKALARSDGNQTAASRLLGISRQALNKRLNR